MQGTYTEIPCTQGQRTTAVRQVDSSKAEEALRMLDPLTPTTQRRPLAKCQGIRSLAVSPFGTELAVAFADPPALLIYSLPNFDLLSVTSKEESHQDAIFSVQWVDGQTLLTGSRDGSLKLWRFNADGICCIWSTHKDYSKRVRDTKIMERPVCLSASLVSNGTVSLWDLNQRQQVSCKLENSTACSYSKYKATNLDKRNGVAAPERARVSGDTGSFDCSRLAVAYHGAG